MTLPLKVSRRAKSQIRIAAAWWRENRPKAPNAFREEVERGFLLVTRLPSAGERVEHSLSGVRRVLLGRIRYYLYYRTTADLDVEVLSLRHASRSGVPELG